MAEVPAFMQRFLGGARRGEAREARGGPPPEDRPRAGSRAVARERLRLVLVHDRASVSPELMPALRRDILGVLQRYVEVDEAAVRLDLNREADAVALTATIPIRRIKRGG